MPGHSRYCSKADRHCSSWRSDNDARNCGLRPAPVRCSAWFGVRAARRSDGPPPEAGRSHALLVVLRPLGRTDVVQRAGELLHELLHLVVVLRLSTIADPELAVLVFDGELIEQPPQTLRQPRAVVHCFSLAVGASAAEL